MKRFECRVVIMEVFDKFGFYWGKVNNLMCLGFCSCSKDVIELMFKL